MDWLKNCKIRMNKGSFYNGMKLTEDVEVINGEPYVGGTKRTWEEVTVQKDYKQRVVNKSFSNVRNMVVNNGKVTIDGMLMEDWYGRDEIAIINVTINGNVERLKMDSCETITVHGDVGDIETMSGKVAVSGVVKGDVETMSGSVVASKIYGDVSTMSGDITER